jgi:hypothetical protein
MIRADGRAIIGRGFLDITNNSRTVTIGAQNNGAIHIYNDNNSPTFVNGSFSSNANGSYDLGTTNYYWNVVYANRIIAKSGDTILCQSSGNCGIGTDSPSYKLHVAGVIYSSTGVYSAGYVTALSDIRKKDVVKNFILKAEDIAAASLIKFTWKDKHDTDLHAGGIAQEWQKLLPEAVHKTADDELSMGYSVIALSSAVSLAREVVSLKKTISDLEARLHSFEQMFAINENDIED